MKRKIILAILALGLLGGAYGLYLFNKPVKSLENQKAQFTISSQELLSTYEANEENANAKFLDKIIQVSGKIDNIEESEAGISVLIDAESMMGFISCELDAGQELNGKKVGDQITIKGLCAGYLLDVVLSRCVIIDE